MLSQRRLVAILAVIFYSFSLASPALATVTIDSNLYSTRNIHNGSSPTVVFTSDQNGYAFYADSDYTCAYSKTTDGGSTWDSSVVVDGINTACIRIAVWYDQWTPGDSGNIIHIATLDSSISDINYITLDTATDSLTFIDDITDDNYSNFFTINKNIHSITKGTDGDIYIAVSDNDASYMYKCESSCDNDVSNWYEAGSSPFDLANDWPILMPLADANIMAIVWDISAGYIQSDIYYDGTNSWSESGWSYIDTDAVVDSSYNAPFGATLNTTTNDIYLVYAADTSSFGDDDDVRSAVYSGGSWTSTTDVITNDEKGVTGAKVAIDSRTGNIYTIYTAQTIPGDLSSANIYYKKSTDGMTTWGNEQGPLNSADKNFYGARMNIMSDSRLYFTVFVAGSDNLLGDTVAILGQSISSPAVTVPSNVSVVINGDPNISSVCSQDIDLSIQASGASRIVISNNEQFLGSEWESFTNPSQRQWVLEPGDGPKKVYFLFKSSTGNLGAMYTVDIELDSTLCVEEVVLEIVPEILEAPSNISDFPEGVQVAPASGILGISPFDGSTEDISIVEPGQFIRGLSYPTVYYVTENMERRPTWDTQTLMTWIDSQDDIVWVTDATLQSLELGQPLLFKPGVVLVGIHSMPSSYWVDEGDREISSLQPMTNTTLTSRLFDESVNDYILYLEPTAFSRFGLGADMDEDTAVDIAIMKTVSQINALLDSFLSNNFWMQMTSIIF